GYPLHGRDVGSDQHGQSEIDELHHHAVRRFAQHDICRLQVTMNDAVAVRAHQSFAHLFQYRYRLFQRQLAALCQRHFQAFARHQFHGNIKVALVLAKTIKQHQVAVPELAEDAGLALEATNVLVLDATLPLQDFQSDNAVEAELLGAINDTETAHRHCRDNLELLVDNSAGGKHALIMSR